MVYFCKFFLWNKLYVDSVWWYKHWGHRDWESPKTKKDTHTNNINVLKVLIGTLWHKCASFFTSLAYSTTNNT